MHSDLLKLQFSSDHKRFFVNVNDLTFSFNASEYFAPESESDCPDSFPRLNPIMLNRISYALLEALNLPNTPEMRALLQASDAFCGIMNCAA